MGHSTNPTATSEKSLVEILVTMRLHHGGPQGAKPKAEVIAQILADIKERKA